jgi:hypothetical protein
MLFIPFQRERRRRKGERSNNIEREEDGKEGEGKGGRRDFIESEGTKGEDGKGRTFLTRADE